VAHEELRAAVEEASKRDLAEMFRTWLIIPASRMSFALATAIRRHGGGN